MDAILTTILSIVVMIFIGYALKRINVVDEEIVPSINTIVLNIFLPCMIFKGLYTANLSQLQTLAILPCLIIITGLLIVVIGYLILSKLNLSKVKIWSILVALMICNTGFMGYPVNLGVFGNPGFIRAIFCDMSASISFLILSVILILTFGGTYKKAIKKILLIIPLWALALGLVFNLLSIPLPPLAMTIISYLGNGTIPLIMISLGLSINFKGLKRNRKIVTCTSIIKLLIFPSITLILAIFAGLSGLDFKIAIIQAAMPSGMMSLILATTYKLDYHLTSDIILINTIFSLITLPLIMYLI